jgi:hypothetical protein
MATRHDAGDQLIDEAVLRATQGRKVKLGGGEKGAWINAPAVRGIEHDRTTALRRL